MSALHDTIHGALIAALTKHGESKYGVCVHFDSVATETKVTGYWKLRHVSEDMTKAVQAKLDADAAAATKENIK
jgi:L-rhamnose mutarotase